MNQLFMNSRSMNCDVKRSYWREIFSKGLGSISLLLMLVMLIPAISFAQDVIYTAPAPYAPAGSPCSAHRWFAGDGWRLNDNTNTVANTWQAVVVASPRLQPKGIVRCASSAEAESQLQNFKGVYNPSDFAIPSTLTDIFDMNAGAGQFTGASINGPTAGEDIVWLNFDIRPFAGTYQFQVVTNERVGWALYHVPVAQSQPQNDPALTYPSCISYPTVACNGRDISGDISCPNPTLVAANIYDYNTSTTRGYSGLSGNGWSLITVPSFAEPTNYYLAMWMESPSVTTFPSSMNLVYKSRYGCGGSTCALELLDSSVTCNDAGGKTVCATFGGSYGQWSFDDVNNNGSNYTITYYRTDGSVASSSSFADGGTVTLDGGTGGIVKAKICADLPANASYDFTLFPNLTYNPSGGQNYVPCKDTAWLRGNQGLPPCTLSASASSSGNLEQISPSPFPGCSKFYTFQATVGNTTISLSTTGGGTITYESPITLLPSSTYSFNSATGVFTQLADVSGLVKFPVKSVDANGCICRDTICVDITQICPGPFDITGPDYLCEFSPGVYNYSFPTNTTSLGYLWSINPSSAGSINVTTTSSGSSATVVPNSSSNTFYVKLTIRNLVFNQDCFSDSILVTLNIPSAGTLASGQTKCVGQSFDQICVTGNSADEYKFERASACGGSFTTARDFAASNCYSPGTTAGAYRVIAKKTLGTAVCYDTSNCIVLKYNEVNAGAVASPQTKCVGESFAAISVSGAGGSGTISYQWQRADNCTATFSNISGATGASYSAGTTAGAYRVVVTSTLDGVPCSATSNCIVLKYNEVNAGAVASPQTKCVGESFAAISVSGAGGSGTISYQWQRADNCTATFSNISGATGTSYNAGTTAGAYRVVVTSTLDGVPCSATSNCIVLKYNEVNAGAVASPQTKCEGIAFSAISVSGATGSGTLSYQWQRADNCTATFSNISGATSTSYNPGTTAGAYRVVVTSTLDGVPCSATSNCIVLKYNLVDAGAVSAPQTKCEGESFAAISVSGSTGSGTLSYQWQRATSCEGTFANISGATGTSYSPGTTAGAYRVVVTSTLDGVACSENSNCIILKYNLVDAGAVSAPQTKCEGESFAAISVSGATGSGTLSYQWQRADNCTATFTNISGATGTSYNAGTTAGAYRVVVTSTLDGVPCAENSNCIVLKYNLVDAGAVSAPQTKCEGESFAVISVSGATGSGTLSYQWQRADNCTATFTNISGATGASYSPGTTAGAYRVVVTSTLDGVPCAENSNCIVLKYNLVNAGTVAAPQTKCVGESFSAISVSGATGSGTLSYQWQRADNCTATFTNISGATGTSYNPGTTAGAYRVVVTSTLDGVPCSKNSNCIVLKYNLVDAGIIDGDTTICNGNLPGTFTGTAGTGSGTISYQWLSSESGCNGPWTAIALSNSQNYTPGILANTTCYVRVTISTWDGVPCYDTSNCICVTVNLCADNCTYTQGYYGSPGKSCDGVTRYNSATDLIRNLLGLTTTPVNPREIVMGYRVSGYNSITIPATDAAAIKLNSVLPGGKTPRALPAIGDCNFFNSCFDNNILTLRGRINNVLLSQALVLTLNSRMNSDRLASFPIRKGWLTTQMRTGCGQLSSPVPCSVNENSIESWQINESVWAFLTRGGQVNATVANLIDLANKVLGGFWVPGTTPLAPANTFPVPSFSAISGACGAFNEGFDECRSFLGYFQCAQTCDNFGLPCPAASTPMFEKVSVPVSGTKQSPKVDAFPNPFIDQTTFVIESPVEAKASLKVYNALGQLVAVPFQGMVPAGKSKNILFRSPVADGSLFYIYEQNGQKVTGKLIKQ